MDKFKESLYENLINRNDEAAKYYHSFIDICKDDMTTFLENIKRLFPEYPDHGIAHSKRIIQYLSCIISKELRDYLSSMDLVVLIFACLFHDSGMALIDAQDDEAAKIRKNHPDCAERVITKYFHECFGNMHEKERVKNAVVFVCKSHGYSLQELLGNAEFNKTDSVKFSTIHYGLLAFLLRIGDLLDIESERANSFRMLMFSDSFNEYSRQHNIRNLNVQRYVFEPNKLEIDVVAENVTQYKIWQEWFTYLVDDIKAFNELYTKETFSLPFAKTNIFRPDGTNYEVQELKFLIDDAGGMWDVLSKSVYTNELDFLRELIQNAIDASLKTIYVDHDVELECVSPRGWENNYSKRVTVCFYHEGNKLIVVDNGIGMDKEDLENHLFKLSSSGHVNEDGRSFAFPGIAQYGIGFIACLINASKIDIYTSKNQDKLYKVSLEGGRNQAFIETNENADRYIGTSVVLTLKNEYRSKDIQNYLNNNFLFPSVPIDYLDLDAAKNIMWEYNSTEIDVNNILNHPYKVVKEIEKIAKLYKKEKKAFQDSSTPLVNLHNDIISLNRFFLREKEYFENKEKVKEFREKYALVKKNITKLGLNSFFNDISIPNFKYGDEEYDDKLDDLFTRITEYEGVINNLISEKNRGARLLQDVVEHIGRNSIEASRWKYFVGYLDSDLRITKAKKCDNLSELGDGNAILLVRNAMCDYASGIEYEAISGFLVSKKKLALHLEILDLGYDYSDESTSISSMDPDMDIQDEIEDDDGWDENVDWFCDDKKHGISTKSICIDSSGKFMMSSGKALKTDDGYFKRGRMDDKLDLLEWEENSDKEARKDVDMDEFMNIVGKTSSVFCQDGIRIDAKIDDLFRWGFFYIVSNFTAGARMKLNVTRHEISEIREDVEPWLNNVGKMVQDSILSEIVNKMKAEKIDFSAREASKTIEEGSEHTFFSSKSVEQLKKLMKSY